MHGGVWHHKESFQNFRFFRIIRPPICSQESIARNRIARKSNFPFEFRKMFFAIDSWKPWGRPIRKKSKNSYTIPHYKGLISEIKIYIVIKTKKYSPMKPEWSVSALLKAASISKPILSKISKFIFWKNLFWNEFFWPEKTRRGQKWHEERKRENEEFEPLERWFRNWKAKSTAINLFHLFKLFLFYIT